MKKRVNVYKPLPKHGHKGHAFREIIDQWEIDGYVNVLASPDRNCWWGKPGEVLLHDHTHAFDVVKELPEFRAALFANAPYPLDDGKNTSNWTMWGWNPRMLDQLYDEHARIKPVDRMWESMFVGKIENQHQMDMRFQTRIDWSKHIQLLAIVKGVHAQYPYSAYDYLWNMAKAKFAILLPGYDPKCCRDIEACAAGAIPIVTPGVCTKYYNEWEEGVNYLRMEKESDLAKLYKTPNKTLNKIQQNNYEWYEANSSIKGVFELTSKIIDEIL